MKEVVAAIIENEDGLVFLQRRPDGTSYAGAWEFPGGKVELHDGHPINAVVREMEEELRPWATIVTLKDLVCSEDVKLADGAEFRVHFYKTRILGNPKPVAPEWGWFTPEGAMSMALKNDPFLPGEVTALLRLYPRLAPMVGRVSVGDEVRHVETLRAEGQCYSA